MDGFDADVVINERIGEVVSVNGSQVVTLIDKSPGGMPRGSFGDLQMGTLVKIPKTHSIAYGIITGLTVPFPSHEDRNQLEILELTMTGESVTEAGPDEVDADLFRRGIRAMPTLGDPVFKATREDLARVYAPPDTLSVKIGTIHQDNQVAAHVLIDELLGKHFAILGTTGAGKSCASARVLHAILEARSNAHIIILDPHGEYAPAFGDRAELLTPQNFELPYWLLTFEELLDVLFGAGYDSGSMEATILADLIPQAKAEFPSPANQAVAPTADTPVPYKLSDLMRQIDSAMGSLDQTGKPAALPPGKIASDRRPSRSALRLHVRRHRRAGQHHADFLANPAYPDGQQAGHHHRPLRRTVGDRQHRCRGAVPVGLRLRSLERPGRADPGCVRRSPPLRAEHG